jgi:ABC-type transport system involved in multi-copper enzyme maturation permease subunit
MTTTRAVSGPRPHAAAAARPGWLGFGQVLRSEWTKFRTVRGWVIGIVLAGLLTALVGLFAAGSAATGCVINNVQQTARACLPPVIHGPGGEVVSDSFYFVHQPLRETGAITARVISLTGEHPDFSGNPAQAGNAPAIVPGLAPWSKAGVIIKQTTRQGSAYAAMTVTGSHGVRMQYDYTHDIAGLPGKVSAVQPRWLRLTRSGDVITGYDSADGRHWTQVGTVHLPGLPATVQVGMFATSPHYSVTSTSFGGSSGQIGPSQATGVFDRVSLSGAATGGGWTGTAIGGGSGQFGPPGPAGRGQPGFRQSLGSFTLTGSGDIAPVTPGPDSALPTATIEQSLAGVFIGLIVIAVVATMFFTAEYRRGLIRTSLAATPSRGAVLAAKAIVAGTAAFAAGLVASVVAISLGTHLESDHGLVVLPVPALTEARVIIGTAALLGVGAVFAVALGAVFRRSAVAITAGIIAVVLPFLLAALNVFPAGVSDWLLRVTPAAGLAIQQSIPKYPQVATVVSPAGGYYPLPPWGGFAVLCCWAAGALALAAYLLRRRDA